MPDPLAIQRLDHYKFPLLGFDCPRCNRHPEADVPTLRARFGNLQLGEIARQIAAGRGCQLAQEGSEAICSVRPVTPPVHHWATLDHAARGGWVALLHCRRHLAALKATKPCRDAVALDLPTLIAALGHEATLDLLPHRLCCPSCGTKSVNVEWIVPPDPPPPGGATQTPEPVRLRPTRAALGRKRFRVVDGG